MSAKIIYSLIARGQKIILADYSDHSGNVQQVALLVLKRLKQNSRYELIYDNYTFYCFDKNDISYVCLVENMTNCEVAFSYLLNLQKKFLLTYNLTKINQSFSYQLKDFSVEIKRINELYKTNQDHTLTEILCDKENNQLDIIKENINDLYVKEEKIHLKVKLPIKTANLNNEKDEIKKNDTITKTTKVLKYIKYAKLILILIALMSFIIWAIIILFIDYQ